MKNFYISLILFLFMMNSWSQDYRRMISEGTYTVQEIQEVAEAYFTIVGKERGKGYKPYKRWEYQALQNMDENGMLKTPDFYFNELQNYNNYINQNSNALRTTVGTWEELGPTSWNSTSGWNPGVGRITSIAVDSGNVMHIIVGANTGGVWRTIDGGVNWTVLTDDLSNLNVGSLVIDPTNSSIYFWGSSGGVIFKSIDDGATWNFHADTGNGTVNKILIDPTNTQKMYCSVEGGGIYKSTNGGVSWIRIHSSATNGYDVEFKPGNTNIVYASGDRFFKSIDSGATFISPDGLGSWTQEYANGTNDWTTSGSNQNNSVTPRTGNAMAFCYVGNFTQPVTRLISPSLNLSGATSPELKFSYTQIDWAGDQDELRVLYKTSVGGSWTVLANYAAEVVNWSDITLALPNVSSDYFIAFEGYANYGRGVTLDDVSVEDASLGIVFQDGFESAPHDFSGGPKMIGISADDPSIVYVVEASSGIFGGFHKSSDSGDTFTKLDHGSNNYFGYSSTADDNSGQAPRDMDITVNPNDVDEVHIAGVLTWRSDNGGVTFNISSQWTPGNAASQNIGYCHADIDILEYVNGKLYVGSDGGVFVANDPNNITTNYFTDLTPGLGIRQFYRFGVSQTSPEVVSGGSQDNGTSVMDSDGDWTDWLGADGMESFIDNNNNSILYGTSQFGSLYKSNNAGVSYGGIGSPDGKSGSWVTPFEQDPIIQGTIYSGYNQVYKSINGGDSWIAISQVFGGNLNHLKIATSNNNIMYAADGNLLYKTSNGGLSNWSMLSGFSGNINSIAIHPTDANKLAIATTGNQKVYVSTNGGVSWSSYLYDLPDFSARALVWQNNGQDGLYLGMNYGVYYIDNTTSNSWQPFSNNLPNVIISELEINIATEKIYAATFGRGLWKSDLYNPTLNIDEFELNAITLSPNPASKNVSLSWNKNDEVSIRIYNSIGKLIYFAKNKSLINALIIDISKYSVGLYFVKINTVDGLVTKKLIVN